MYDVIVIGAGPAGAAAALSAAEYGMSVVVLEQNRFPRQKTCTGCLSRKSLKSLSEMGLRIPSDMVRGSVTGIILWSPGMERRSRSDRQSVGVMVDRSLFDRWLLQEAQRRGVTFRDGEPVRDLVQSVDHVEVFTDKDRLYGRFVVGADGVGGLTAKLAGIRKRWSWWELGMTWSTTLQLKPVDARAVLALCSLPTTWGWAFPYNDGVHIGVGGAQLLGQALQRCFWRWLAAYTGEGLDTVAHTQPIRFPVPAGGFRRRIAKDRVMLVGDAAGLVDPFAGEGIHLALASGRAATQAIKEYWQGPAAHAYQSWADALLPDLRLSIWLSLLLGKRGPMVGQALCRSDWAVEALTAWMAGECSYRDLIWKSLVRS